ncbi:bifunctional hydroxymethylpyrimidine kinase/phosphomethylpyrimidine kinase [Denitromonas iodatirespirans]|uniref:hydroxymethylpyrimidine kinase n=1 Tax=Denitromonas iodatirespirans TaxID=2795389 RepID=A0A944DGA7_DENI1|nr:bifunctional hydroxymethylpyrimidine kinase/phosphomethylpyrimidine kinase [Denitromonas iodatirespirans]MBT0962298.1 bifunctional hydroxymethylpyrimidine kinase/phosphomethylpyrimidine kinase [Denitromonas iodatirespirans]
MTSSIPNVLTIAGIDPSGGAGVFADLKTFSALGAYGCGVVAALTAQNTTAVTGIHTPPTDFLKLQIDTLFDDVTIHAVKIGMLGTAGIVRTVAEGLARYRPANVVLDPVMVAKSGDHLLAREAVAMLKEALLPQVFMLTPNLPEAGVLLDGRAPESLKEMYRAAERLRELLPHSGERWVLLKGGHLPGSELIDLLFNGDRMVELPARRLDTKNTHGTGCTLSSAIAALLPQRAGQLRPVEAAVRDARQYLLGAIAASGQLAVGKGHGPVHHFHALWR